jgi:5-methylthioadenosine/S-adenosylhomocysteine deaminase
MKYSILLKNANVISHDGKISSGKYIYIKDDKIDKICTSYTDNATNEIDCSSYFITPGLVNLHAHSPMNIFKGIAEDVTADNWFNKEIWPYESKILSDDIYYGSLLSMMEMMDNGITAFADHYFDANMICKAALHTGIKADIAPTLFGLADNFDEQLENVSKQIIDTNGKYKEINIRMGPHSPYTCNDKQLMQIIDRANELKVGMHLHVSETKEQVENSLKTYGKTPFELLESIGAFKIPTIIAHGLWIQDDDIKHINENVAMAVCTKTYMKLACGYGKIWNYYKTLPLAIGTDGSASSNTVDCIEQARLFALVGKFMNNNPEAYSLADIWKIMMKGHEALEFNSGKIEEGYCADIIIWNLDDINTAPIYNPLSAIIYSSSSKNVHHLIINGNFVKKNGQLCIDKEIIIKEAKERARDILNRGKGKTKLVF